MIDTDEVKELELRTFTFPNYKKCPICGTNDNKLCMLVPISGTEEGHNVEAVPVHLDCLKSLAYYPRQKLICIRAEYNPNEREE